MAVFFVRLLYQVNMQYIMIVLEGRRADGGDGVGHVGLTQRVGDSMRASRICIFNLLMNH